MIEQQLRQRGVQAQEGHFIHAVFPQPVVGQVQRLQARTHVGEDVAWDALDVVVVQRQMAQGHRQEGRHVHQLIMG